MPIHTQFIKTPLETFIKIPVAVIKSAVFSRFFQNVLVLQ